MSAVNSDDIFWDNLLWNSNLVLAQRAHAKGVKTRARSGYYKVAFLLAASIVEALTHRILREKLNVLPKGNVPFLEWECFDCDSLPEKYCLQNVKLALCKRRHPRFELTKHTDFKQVNDMCLQLGIITKPFYQRLEKVRILRNKVHLQGLDHVGRRWTNTDLNQCTGLVSSLLRKVK